MVSVAAFAPETNGFRFPNSFPTAPVITLPIPGWGPLPVGDVSNGLCGGMVFAARDFFESHQNLPIDANPPAPGSPLFEMIVRRLIDSFDLPDGPLRYFQWMNLPDEDSWIGAGVATLTRAEAAKLRHEVDRGRLACLGLVRSHSHDPSDLGKNHQVLAYGYALDEANRLTTHLYDPNHPDGDTRVTIDLTPRAPLQLDYSSGEPTRGFFVSSYHKVDPRVASDSGGGLSLVEQALRLLSRPFR